MSIPLGRRQNTFATNFLYRSAAATTAVAIIDVRSCTLTNYTGSFCVFLPFAFKKNDINGMHSQELNAFRCRRFLNKNPNHLCYALIVASICLWIELLRVITVLLKWAQIIVYARFVWSGRRYIPHSNHKIITKHAFHSCHCVQIREMKTKAWAVKEFSQCSLHWNNGN